jgi:AraC-like DNA-binding protein
MNDRFRIASNIAQRLKEHKVPLAAVLRHAGLPANFFDQEKIHATTAEFFALWRAVGEVSADPAIGLKLGSETRLERFQPTAIAAVCSKTFGDAVERMGRYKQLVCPEEIHQRREGKEIAVEFVFTEATEDEPDVLVDNCLSWILSIGQRGTEGRVAAVRLELMRPVKHRELLEKHFGCRVKFKAERNAVVFRSSDLDLPFTTHNAELLAALGAQLDSELAARRSGPDVGAQVKHALKRSLAGKRPVLQDVAQELGTSTRTLQRRLGDAGITFQHVVEETRRELAHHYLKQSVVELHETAYLLGYEDVNSFFRAFNAWEGVTPGEWRAQHRLAVA